MTDNATAIRQTARPRGGRASQRPGHPAAAPRQLALANHQAAGSYATAGLAAALTASSHSCLTAAPHSCVTGRRTQRSDRRRRGWMTGTAIPKARPPEGRSRPRRRHGHAARSDHQPRGRPGDSNQAPSPAHALGPSDHVSQITLDSHSNRPAEITATPHLPCPPATARGLSRPPTWPARRPPTLPPGRDTESANMRTSSNAGVW